ncbi:MAG: sulfite oxidase heme-binding subunit YedZ [Terriglobales bacterium]
MKLKLLKLAIFFAALLPVAHLVWKAFHDELGANPIEVITHSTGDWTLTFLLLTLSITPLRRITGWQGWIRFRRMLGLYAFFYGCLHLTTWVWLDKFFNLHDMADDLMKRRFIFMGMTGLLLMLPLAVTSTKGWIRRLGKRWQKLHRLIYFSAIAGVIHYAWLVKADETKPIRYAIILSVLLGIRVVLWLRKRSAPRPAIVRPQSAAAD